MRLSSSSLAAKTTYTWEDFDRLPRTGPDFLVDTKRIQQRLDARKDNPYRIRTVCFAAPKGCSRGVFEELKKNAGEKFLYYESKEGWELQSPLRLTGPFLRQDPSGAVILGDEEYRWQAIFKQTRSAGSVRIEFDPATVKQDPEHRLTIREAVKAWGLKPQEVEERPATAVAATLQKGR